MNSIYNDISTAVKDYIRFYNKGFNVDVKLEAMMKKWKTQTGVSISSDAEMKVYNEKKKEIAQKLIAEKVKRKNYICKSNHNLDYLDKCMEEYLEEGAFNIEKHWDMTEYFDVIQDFIKEYKKSKSSILVKDFLSYVKRFLMGSLDENVPILSTIHAMKGGEADNVFIYDYPEFPYSFNKYSEEEKQQEVNLEYVAITRAKKNLYLIETGDEEKNSKCREKIAFLGVKNKELEDFYDEGGIFVI